MAWQDYAITIVSLFLSYSLIPQVYHGFKKKKKTVLIQTSIITFLGLIIMDLSYFSLGLFFAGITTTIMVTLWGLLLLQGIIYKE